MMVSDHTDANNEMSREAAEHTDTPRGGLLPVMPEYTRGIAHRVVAINPVYPFQVDINIGQYSDEIVTACGMEFYSPRPYGNANRSVTMGRVSCPNCS